MKSGYSHKGSAFAALKMLALVSSSLAGGMIVSAPAAAQDYTQISATGRVTGTDGKGIGGATIEVTSNDQGFSRTVTTDSSGGYRISQLPPGSYTFTISADGFDTFTDSAVPLSQGSAANQFALSPTGGAAGGDIVVVGGRTSVPDFDRNTTGAVIRVGEIATRVPIARDITSVVLLSPGTAAGDTAFGNLPSINGASVSENVYYVNGLNITQFRNGLGAVTVPFDFYDTVEVKNGAIAAEFGRTTGGVINATTKSGSNKFHVSGTFNWEPDDLRSDTPNTFATDADSASVNRTEFIAQASGPIIKDRLFFYALVNTRSVTSAGGFTGTSSTTTTGANACTSNPTMCRDFANLRAANLTTAGTQYIRDSNNSPFYGGKLDAVIIDGHRLEATYFNTSGETTRDTYGTSLYTLASGQRYNPNTNAPGGYASSTVFRSGGENYVFRYTGTFTNWLSLSAAYGRNYNRDTTESNTPNLPSILDQRNGANTGIGNTTANAQLNFDKRTFYRADADLNFQLLGAHHVRGGYDREELDLSSFTQANGGFQFTLATAGGAGVDPVTGLPTGTNYAIARTFVSGGQFTTRNEAFYIQDSWSLFDNRLRLNLGLRNDRFVNRNADGVAFYTTGNQLGPRLGAILDVFGDQTTKLYGSFSRYFLPVAVNTNVRLAGSELDYDAYYRLTGLNSNSTPILGAPITTGAGFETCPPGGPAGTSCVIRNDGTVPGTDTTVASNLKSQSTDEFIIGAERRLGSKIRVGAFFTYTKLNDSLEDAALDTAIVPLCVAAGNTDAACRAIYNGVHQYALINPGRDVAITLSDPFPNQTTAQTVVLSAASLGYPQAKRTYTAATVTFDRDFDGKWSFSASYTWSKLRGNIEGGIRSDNGQTDSGLTTAFDLPALVNGSNGNLPNDRRHNFKFYGSYNLFDWLNIGGNLQITSPRSFGCLGRAPANADANLAGRFYGAAAFYCNLDAGGNVISNPVGFTLVNPTGPGNSTLQLTPRGSQFQSDWVANLNIDAAIKIPTDVFQGTLRVSVFNVLNRSARTDFVETGTATAGTPNATYGLPNTYQAPRSVRLQLAVGF